MKVILIQQGCVKALKDYLNMPTSMSQKKKVDMINKTKSVIILCPNDKELRELTKEKITTLM